MERNCGRDGDKKQGKERPDLSAIPLICDITERAKSTTGI